MNHTHKHLGIWDKECNCKKWFNNKPSVNWFRWIKDCISWQVTLILNPKLRQALKETL